MRNDDYMTRLCEAEQDARILSRLAPSAKLRRQYRLAEKRISERIMQDVRQSLIGAPAMTDAELLAELNA